MADDIIICRCEDMTRQALLDVIAEGYETIDEIKRVTRAGMGPCQGRTCRQLIAGELSRIYGIPMECKNILHTSRLYRNQKSKKITYPENLSKLKN